MVLATHREAIVAWSAEHPVWRTSDDRWTSHPREAGILRDEAHAQLRLVKTLAAAGDVADVRLTTAPT